MLKKQQQQTNKSNKVTALHILQHLMFDNV